MTSRTLNAPGTAYTSFKEAFEDELFLSSDESEDYSESDEDSSEHNSRWSGFKSWLLMNNWLLATIVGIASALLICICVSLMQQETSSLSATNRIDPVQQTKAQFDTVNQKIGEEIAKTDLNTVVSNPGNLQKVRLAEGAAMNQRVTNQIADEHSPNYGLPEDVVYQDLRSSALLLVNMGASGIGATLSYRHPETGKKVDVLISPAMLAVIGHERLEAIRIAENPVAIRPKLAEVAKDTNTGQEELKAAKVALLEAQGLKGVADRLRAKDIYGRPQTIAPTTVPLEYETNPLVGY